MMMKRGLRAAAAVVLTAVAVLVWRTECGAQAAQVPPTADAVMATALKSAQATGRVVLIEFGASWCVWCRSFEAFVNAPEIRQIVASNFVVVNLTVQEREEKKALEHPGAQEKMDAWGGTKSGLPYYVFLDASGRKIADSNAMPDGSNIGFPATPQELQVFTALIEKTAPKLSKPDRAKIVDYLNKNLKR
jgi:thiol:disulfide interchange protein